ncbi:O-antigen ligase family protein [Mycolicibacterium vanbaalenii]|uniref:O-antigen ligase family protein n=1 Tax=Mycolicibacterium vanbaalenii TaxID=110539 RepID=UPI001F25ABC6|nr:O-antigen ligase family protein [Mycolicibacterium vanbaalenii]UJL31493.1 O-antigen ligase family protein [Mycolicibacterium vanbaalenii]WND58342.1 O-antigen ligase family protein [Mycolicibacterium vanbaalenii]
MGEWNAARNMGFIALTFFVVYISAARGLPIGVLLRNTLRAAALYSLFMWVFRHAWYVNASEYFVDSGKIFSTFPNVYGILSHPNYTALMFGSALVLEFALWARYSSWRLSALFSLISFVILLTTQGRNAIGAAVMGVISVLLYRHGRTGWVSLIVALAFLASWIPFALMIPVYMFGGSPAYGWLSAFTNRGSLWAAILEILPEGILFGKGQAAIFEAHRYVSDSDVSDVTHAHNQVLDLLLVGGLIAGFLYLSLYSVIVSRIASKHAPADGVGLVVVLTFTTITESPLTPYVTQIGVILFIAAIAILFSSNEINSRRTRPNLARPTANDGGPLFRRANHRNTAAKLP